MSPQQEPPEQTIILKERADYWVAIHEEIAEQRERREALCEELVEQSRAQRT